jgi:hypothetical protein
LITAVEIHQVYTAERISTIHFTVHLHGNTTFQNQLK